MLLFAMWTFDDILLQKTFFKKRGGNQIYTDKPFKLFLFTSKVFLLKLAGRSGKYC